METLVPDKRSARVGKDDRRSQILEIALEMFLKQGFAAVSMSAIAARVGGSKATLYNYFPSKEELFAATVAARCERLQSIIYEAEAEGGSFRETLKRFGESVIALFMGDEGVAMFRLVVAESARFPELGHLFYELGPNRGNERVAEFLSHGIAQGALKAGDVMEMGRTFIDLLVSDLHKRRLCNVAPEPSPELIARHAERAVWQFMAIYGTEK
jgi:AcrR family transcriptional regulator